MMKKIDKVQLFIRRNIGAIRTVALLILLALVAIMLANQISEEKQNDRERVQSVQSAVSQVVAENDQQSRDIRRQFQALCVVVVQTSGDAGLQQLDKQTAEKCKSLIGKE